MNILYSFTKIIFQFVFKLFYRHEAYGIENLVSGPAIIAPNHLSFLDPPLVGASCPEPVAFLAKRSLFTIPVLGWFIRQLNAYPVSGKIKDIASIKMILKILENKQKVVIFPEGLRSCDGKLAHIKPGICMLAQRANTPIIPAYIEGTYKIWKRGRKFPKLRGRTTCIFGKPIYPKDFEMYSKKEAQEKMAQEIKLGIEKIKSQMQQQGCL